MTAGPTIVIPSYGNADDLRRCLASIHRWSEGYPSGTNLLVIDDASPGDEVAAVLEELGATSDGPPTTVLRNDENRGFAATVNRGFAETEGDVVILNTDTVVTDGWLRHLVETAGGDDVATVTPLTNSGSICTMPTRVREAFGLDGDTPAIDECAAFVRANSLGARPAVISGVGFCMHISRAALDAVGPFDVEAFGAGYGEEVDFCLRARAAGWRHLVEDTTFVYHRGGGTFGATRAEGMNRASKALHGRHPGFRRANTLERMNEPLASSFAALELALDERTPGRPHVLHLLHTPSPYGGTEKHVSALIDAMRGDVDFSVLAPVSTGFVLEAEWQRPDGSRAARAFQVGVTPHHIDHGDEAEPLPSGAGSDDALRTALDMFPVDVVHLQNLIGHSLGVFDVLRDFAGTVVCTIHDLYLACPNHSLLFLGRESCGIPDDLSVCAACLPETRGLTVDDLIAHRATVGRALDVVDHWVCATQSAADYLLRAYEIPAEHVAVIPHGSVVDPIPRPPLDEAHVFEDPLRVAFVGRGWTKKGLDIVNQLADDLPEIAFHHFGEMRDEPSANVVAHGPYDNRELPTLLYAEGIHVVLLPGPYAETFGFVMTEAQLAGLPVIGPGYGAIGERIRRDGTGWTIDPDRPATVRELLENLDAGRLELWRATLAAREVPIEPVRSTAPAYAALYGGATARGTGARR
jgi:GT2 family glycosyltransferase/glycosyltransferase involved in cell wall biosynthesis